MIYTAIHMHQSNIKPKEKKKTEILTGTLHDQEFKDRNVINISQYVFI